MEKPVALVAYHAGRRLSNPAGLFRTRSPALGTFLVSSRAVAHTAIRANSPEEAGRLWLAWRRKHRGELHGKGVRVLLRLDAPVRITDGAGKRKAEIQGGRYFYPVGGAPGADPVLIGGKHQGQTGISSGQIGGK